MGDKESDDLELQTLLSENETKYKESSNPEKEGQAKDQEEEHFVRWRKTAIFISCVSIIFTTGFGLTFFVISEMAKSPAAFGFAFAAVLDSFSSVVVLWRFSGTKSQESNSSEREKERRACIAIAICFILSAFAIASKAVYSLIAEGFPGMEHMMEMLSIASLLILIFLTCSKCLVAYKVHSRAMKTDGINSLAGAVMTLGMITSDIVCQNNPSICYLDSATAILIAIALFSYGVA